MPATEPPFDLLAQRADLLRAVRGEATPKPELAAALSVSRSTVDRAVRDLEASGLVERDGGVSLTLKGRLALDSYETFAAHLRDLNATESALDTLPDDARVDRALLRDATVVEATPVAPQRATEAYRSLVADATRVRGYASALLDGNVQTFRERIVEDGLEADLVLDPDVLDALVGAHGSAVADARDTGRLTMLEATDELAYSLMLVETPATTHACALFYDESGHTGLVRNDSREAVEWAEAVYDELRVAADLLPE
jgi:predicted transcriptional regulator